MRARRMVGAVCSVLLLAGCGALHPGAAAVVGGHEISQGVVDDMAQALCAYTKVANRQRGLPTGVTSTREMRRSALQILVSQQLVQRAARRLHVSVTPAQVAQAVATDQSASKVTGPHGADLQTLIHIFARDTLLTAQIGRKLTAAQGGSTANPDAAASAYLTKVAKRVGVDVSPSFGHVYEGQLQSGSGSLSVAVSGPAVDFNRQNPGTEWVKQRPASQRCG